MLIHPENVHNNNLLKLNSIFCVSQNENLSLISKINTLVIESRWKLYGHSL